MRSRTAKFLARRAAPASALAALAVAAQATTPSPLAWGVRSLAVRCLAPALPQRLTDEICSTTAAELERRISLPIAVAAPTERLGSTVLVVDVTGDIPSRSTDGAGHMELSMRLVRPGGREGRIERPPTTSDIPLDPEGRPMGLRPAIAEALDQILGSRGRFRFAPSAARAD